MSQSEAITCECCAWKFWPQGGEGLDEQVLCGLCQRARGLAPKSSFTERMDADVRGYMAAEGNVHSCEVLA